MGHEGAVESREREAREVVGFVARGVDAEDDVHLCARARERELPHRVDHAVELAFARVDGLRRHHDEDARR
jgi:hypothetical protein